MFPNWYGSQGIPKFLCFVTFGMTVFPTLVSAQVSVDNTLGIENSIVTPNIVINGVLSDRVDGGATRGSNLFHSFSDLNVVEGRGVYFSNPTGITNIINRVTGSNASSILGKLGVLGNANLFLINPNGIIFGPHASLDLGGSFVATTANAIQFGEQGSFSASNPEAPPLLTVNPSAFIFNRLRANPISLNSSKEPAGVRFNDIYGETNVVGLRVPNGQSLILLGGDLNLTNSEVNALEGRVELGAIAGIGTVGLTMTGNAFSLNFPSNLALADVSLVQGSRVYTTGDRGGSIQVVGNNIRLTEGSNLSAETFGPQSGGNIVLNAGNTIEVIEPPPYGVVNSPNISTITYGEGNGGNIIIDTKKLLVQNGAQISVTSAGNGNGGQLFVNASESVELIGAAPDGTYSALNAIAVLVGKGGNINITTQDLTIHKGGNISSESLGFEDSNNISDLVATGASGNITINASHSVSILDANPNDGIFARTTGVGNAGNVTINTGTLTIQNGGLITVASDGEGVGSAGNLTINASKAVNVIGNGSILTATGSGFRPAGSLTIKTGQMTVSGGAQVKVNNPISQAGNLSIDADSLIVTDKMSSIVASTESGQAGNISIRASKSVNLTNQGAVSVEASKGGIAGNLTIKTGQMKISNSARATVSSPEGQAGNLTIAANTIFLNRGFLTAETAQSGVNGANINLQLSDLLQMQNESLISAKATGTANGGNIAINSPLLAVLPSTGPNGSDIIAQAEQGNGGNILINSQGIFGIAEGNAIAGNGSNDIDASSEFGAPGRVLLNNNIDPSQGTVELPEDVVDSSTLIAQNACRRGTASQLTLAGRGGLPPTVYEDLNSKAIQVGLVEPAPSSKTEAQTNMMNSDNSLASSSFSSNAPAQGWVFNQKGEVMLVAYDPTVTGAQRVKVNRSGCLVP